MTENTKVVLEMLAEGKITTDQAERLIAALHEKPGSSGPAPAKPRFLRVIVDAGDGKQGPVKVNIRVPLMLLRAGVRLGSLIPARAQEEVNRALRQQGIDADITKLKAEDLDELINELKDLTIDVDHEHEDVKIRVFAE